MRLQKWGVQSGAVYVCVWGGGRVRWICGISGWVSSSNCLANFSDLAEKGKTSKTCYRDCGNIWPLLGTGAAIQQVCFPIYTFFSVLSLVCRWVFSLFNHSFFSSMKKPVLLALLSSRFWNARANSPRQILNVRKNIAFPKFSLWAKYANWNWCLLA